MSLLSFSILDSFSPMLVSSFYKVLIPTDLY